ncbi:MAG: hydrogenase expression/formation protein HypE [Candidatus Zixiibacteriota bacterium]|jgi:hydrogenase expression/formation protein HypE
MNRKSSRENLGSCPRPLNNFSTIQLAHGSGGRLTADLITEIFLKAFDNPALNKQNDQAIVEVQGVKVAFTTDSFVVDPIFFPGGDIGDLAVNGTINDLCMCGAKPLFLSAGLIIEEGLPIDDLQKIIASMQRAAAVAGVEIVTGDTKVVDKGKGDKIFVNTSGIGVVEHDFTVSADNLKLGDVLIISGTIADHGMAILSRREGLSFESPIVSDTAALNSLVELIMQTAGSALHAMRDPTRGGVAATLNEFASSSKVNIRVQEDTIPILPAVAGACELLGLDPLYVANEGKLVAAVEEPVAQRVIEVMRHHPLGRKATVIGRVEADHPGRVTLKTRLGTERMVDMPTGEQLPRIC